MNTYNVKHRPGENKWAVARQFAGRASALIEARDDAVTKARALAKGQGKIKVFEQDGTITEYRLSV